MRPHFSINEVGPNTVIVVPTKTLVEAERKLGRFGREIINSKFLNEEGRRVIAHELKEHRFVD
jgi:hypothetical protein